MNSRNIAPIIVSILFITACSSKINPPTEKFKQNLSKTELNGKQVYMDNCNTCHPAGRAGLGPAIFNKPLPGFIIKFQVRNGIGKMPAFDTKHISINDLDNLINYIKSQ
jgi:mono/diheme cytochrome c family protein